MEFRDSNSRRSYRDPITHTTDDTDNHFLTNVAKLAAEQYPKWDQWTNNERLAVIIQVSIHLGQMVTATMFRDWRAMGMHEAASDLYKRIEETPNAD